MERKGGERRAYLAIFCDVVRVCGLELVSGGEGEEDWYVQHLNVGL